MTEVEFMEMGGSVNEEPEVAETNEEEITEDTEDDVVEQEDESSGSDDDNNDTPEVDNGDTQPQGIQPTAAQQAYRNKLFNEYQQALNHVNPYTGNVIQSPQEFFEYKRQYAEEQRRYEQQRQAENNAGIYEAIQNGTASKEQFDAYIKEQISRSIQDNPDIRNAREAAIRIQQEEQRAKIESGKSRLQSDIDQLNKEYPNCGIKKPEDITDSKMIGYMRKGLSVGDAYYLANKDSIAQAQAAGIRQAVVNQANGKSHLKTVSGGTTGEFEVPDDIISEYRHFFPDWTEKQIVENYKKRNGGKK